MTKYPIQEHPFIEKHDKHLDKNWCCIEDKGHQKEYNVFISRLKLKNSI